MLLVCLKSSHMVDVGVYTSWLSQDKHQSLNSVICLKFSCISRRGDCHGFRWLQRLRTTGRIWVQFLYLLELKKISISSRSSTWPKWWWWLLVIIMTSRVSLRCQAFNPLLPAQSFEDSLLLDIYCEFANIFSQWLYMYFTLIFTPWFQTSLKSNWHWAMAWMGQTSGCVTICHECHKRLSIVCQLSTKIVIFIIIRTIENNSNNNLNIPKMVSDYILFANLWQFSLEICFSSQDCPPISGNLQLDQKYDIISNNASSMLGPKIRRAKLWKICKPILFFEEGDKSKKFSADCSAFEIPPQYE